MKWLSKKWPPLNHLVFGFGGSLKEAAVAGTCKIPDVVDTAPLCHFIIGPPGIYWILRFRPDPYGTSMEAGMAALSKQFKDRSQMELNISAYLYSSEQDLGFSFVSCNDNVLAVCKHTNTEAVLNRSMTYMSTYYEILGLPKALHHEPHLPAQTLRAAYRRALLQNHPDKVIKCTSAAKIEIYSIDQITKAFSTLSNATLRGEYDKEVKLQQTSLNINGLKGEENFYTGIETVDLDDLDTNEEEGIWFRFCRCGDDQGFLIREADLEEAVDDGEISVGCRGCSLWLKVLFGVMDDVQGQDAAGQKDAT